MILTDSELIELVAQMEGVDRIAVDTEADSLHCYYEKLCLIQLSFGDRDYLIDNISDFNQHFYVCGPDPFVKNITGLLADLGAKPDTVIFEK